MVVWKAPPGRSSKATTSVVQGVGHHHCASSAGSLQARHKAARGARSTRLMTRSRESIGAAAGFDMGLLLLV